MARQPEDIIGIIMAGGSGERFWPLSRLNRPKQFLPFGEGDASLLREATLRLKSLVGIENVWIATQPHLVNAVQAEVPEILSINILAEPSRRNTAGAVVWLAAWMLARGLPMSTVMAICTSDHRIDSFEGFKRSFDAAVELAESKGALVTIGIVPTRPDTGFGYIERDPTDAVVATRDVRSWKVARFHEKPGPKQAQAYLRSDSYMWNSGMFFWSLGAFLEALVKASPNHHAATLRIAEALADTDPDLARESFESLPNISIDHALLEKANNVWVTESAFGWDDLGTWEALGRVKSADDDGNRRLGPSQMLESRDNIIFNESPGQEVYVLGVQGMTIVVTQDAILVCPTERTQDIRQVVELVRNRSPEKL